MSNDNLPVVRANQQIAKKDEPEAGVVTTKAIKNPPSPATSAAGQIVKAVVSAALDWFDQRRTMQSRAVDRRVRDTNQKLPHSGGQSFTRMSGGMRDRFISAGGKGRFGSHRRLRKQRCKSGNRRFNKHKGRAR